MDRQTCTSGGKSLWDFCHSTTNKVLRLCHGRLPVDALSGARNALLRHKHHTADEELRFEKEADERKRCRCQSLRRSADDFE